MGLLRNIVRGRRDFGPPMGRPRMVPNIPAPIPPLEPFERLPFDDPRNDFMSIQRIEDVGVPGITPIEPVMPPTIPLPIPPVPSPVQPIVPTNEPTDPVNRRQIPTQGIIEKMPVPPKREDFMSIGGPGGGLSDLRQVTQIGREIGAPGTGTPPPLPEERYGTGKMFDPVNLPEGYSFQDTGGIARTAVMPPPGFVYAYGPDGDRISVPSGEPGAAELRNQPPLSSILGDLGTRQPEVGDGMTEPSLIGEPNITPADYRPQIDPVLAQQDTTEILSDPLLRALYFGTADQPGFINQLQQATQNVMGAELPSTQFDQSMTQQFFNPYEDRVVQQTIQDVMDFGEKQDIAARARDIQTGGLSAFGSRARLTADERREALGRGLAESLSGIRQSGFSEAQRTALNQFGDQYARQMGQINRPIDLLTNVGRSLPGYGAQQTTIESDYRLPVDPTAAGLGAAFSTYSAFKPGQTASG